jgi:hypothetical protein
MIWLAMLVGFVLGGLCGVLFMAIFTCAGWSDFDVPQRVEIAEEH